MGNFKHHSNFQKEKQIQRFLFPHVCFHCRKSFKKPKSEEPRICPKCGGQLQILSRKFAAPKTSDTEQWQKVQYLVAHGFFFDSVYEKRPDGGRYVVGYPQTLNEAQEFVVKFQDQAQKVTP